VIPSFAVLFPASRRPLTALLAAALAIVAITGCSNSGSSTSQKTVSDPNGLFHFKIPADWQSNTEQGLITVYGAEDLPESGEIDALSLIVLSGSTEDTGTPVGAKIVEIVDQRAASRGWTDYSVSDPGEVMVGDRPGARVEVAGVDAEGVAFEGAYHIVRTAGSDVLIVAVSPDGGWSRDREQLDDVFEQWYWLRAETEDQAP
jgi:hypothetical protein